jgi:Tfp pilus assembly protein PilF
VPEIEPSSFFASIPKETLRAVEIGSPAQLRRAASSLYKSGGGYSLPESVLLNVCAEVTRLAWPSSPPIQDKPPVTEKNAYTGALDSVRLGIYDVSTGNVDFLTDLLPSLILLTSSTRNDYYARSEGDLKAALNLNGDSVLVNYLLGILCKKKGDGEGAFKYFQEALRLDGTCFEVRLAFASSLYGLGRLSEAEQAAARLLSSYPDSVQALKLAAEIAFAQKKYPQAGEYVARVLQQEPENSYYLLFRARILILTGEYIKAASLLDAYSRTDNTSRDYLLLRAQIQSGWNKNTPAAIATVEQALSLYPSDSEVILLAAKLAGAAGRRIAGRTAGDYANLILAKTPDDPAALAIVVADAVSKRRWMDAYRSSVIIQKQSPSLGDSITHVVICLALGNNAEARSMAESLYARDGENDDVRQVYIKMLVAQGERIRALGLINTWLSAAKPSMKSFLYWQRSLLGADGSEILNDLRLSLTSDPRNSDALMEMYTYYFTHKDYRKAQYYLKQVVALNPNDEHTLELSASLEKLLN